ncbi:hypothetical protein LOAG_11211 [Loa loa]|uniref:Uncharacterized protein n=1 Tax=Loa loa TaxID=7209 RepID=A0A1S0TPK3_LOALO|nr:hypothetical protein LOAG_11211 [Loa loa]EFO17289.1 hypothetical protein LOAG_11211 [Loa loa]
MDIGQHLFFLLLSVHGGTGYEQIGSFLLSQMPPIYQLFISYKISENIVSIVKHLNDYEMKCFIKKFIWEKMELSSWSIRLSTYVSSPGTQYSEYGRGVE